MFLFEMASERKNSSMTYEQRNALKSIDLYRSLNIDEVIICMQAKGHLLTHHVEKIEATKRNDGPTAARIELLRILPTRGDMAFIDFYICLRANQSKLADLLVSALPKDYAV